MKTTNLRRILWSLLFLVLAVSSSAGKYHYETVENDPMGVKIYTLPNGLKIYMSVNKDVPRIQTNIAVRVGGKNDPAATTGLAHYFEHLMFKGTPEFGTIDYAAEKPMLDEIERLFEKYRITTDSLERAAIYHAIDSISYQASKLAIPNEYDKLMSAIGSSGTNAYTSFDQTCYVEDIPSNQLDNWAKIQAARFKNPVLRGFHTELETIYEEKNMSLTDDYRKLYEKSLEMLFPHHPYGTQTVLGTQEHLKNPSITNVKNYHKKWYVPNNMAIVMSGDFDPDDVVDVVTKYFGDMQPNPSLEMLKVAEEQPITSPIVGEVVGPEAEMVRLVWRIPGSAHPDTEVLNVVDNIFCNGHAGILDLNVNQKQLTLGSTSFPADMVDHSMWVISGSPKSGQSLDDLRELYLEQVKKLRDGDFDEALIPAVINDIKKSWQVALESNGARVDQMVSAFVANEPWSQVVTSLDRQSRVTKQDVMDFARKYLRDDNYAVIYKRQGKDESIAKIAKPKLTPIEANRDARSQFLIDIVNTKVDPIEPRWVDYDSDLSILKGKNDMQVLYKKNETNDLFQLTYVFDTGTLADKLLPYASGYLKLIGTDDMTPEQLSNKFYSMGCSYFISTDTRRSYIVLSGLSENMNEAMELMEHVIYDAQPDAKAWDDYKARVVKARQDNKGDQSACFNALSTYSIYGKEVLDRQVSNQELDTLTPGQILASGRRLLDYDHRIIYYGPLDEKQVLASIDKHHRTPARFAPVPANIYTDQGKLTPETVVYVAPFDSNQLYMYMYSNNGDKYDEAQEPIRKIYNSYFGGDMSSIVFQEMRERRSLAYSAQAGYNGVNYLDKPYTYMAFIATQNDKLADAVNAFHEIINDMPRSEGALSLAKDGLESNLRTKRVIKDNVAWQYISDKNMEVKTNRDKALFEALPGVSLDDVVAYQQKNIKDRKYMYCILGRVEDLDMDFLNKLGKVVVLTPEEIFGY